MWEIALGIFDRVTGFLRRFLRRDASLARDLRPYLIEARDFFSDVVANGGATSDEVVDKWGPIERRLEEFDLRDKKLRGHVEALVSVAKEVFAIAPPTRYVWVLDNRPESPEDREWSQRHGETVEPARRAEEAARNGLRRLSRIAGRTGD